MFHSKIPGKIHSPPDVRHSSPISDENSPNVNGNAPNPSFYHQKLTPYSNSNQEIPQSVLNSSIRSRNNVPLVFRSTNTTNAQGYNASVSRNADAKLLVTQMLRNDTDRLNFSVISQLNNDTIVDIVSPLESVGIATAEVESEEEEEESNDDIGNQEGFNSGILSGRTLMELASDSHKDEDAQTDSDKFYQDSVEFTQDCRAAAAAEEEEVEEEEYDPYADPRYSALNFHEPYVKIAPLMLGQPLAPAGTPLDLSCVEKRVTADPLCNDDDREIISTDELKMYSLLEYELNKIDSSLNTNHYFDIDDKKRKEHYEEEVQKSSSIRSMISLLFHRPSQKEKYFDKYPWHRILHKIDNPEAEDEEKRRGNHHHEKPHNFETNNTDMFPVHHRSYSDERSTQKHAIAYVCSRNDG